MGRNPKVGLDYFPLDTAWDIKMQLVKAKYGLEGVGCIIELFKLIYSEGYALKWDDDTRILFASSNHIEENTLDNILIYSVEKGIFHRGIYDKLRILTSSGIQKRWVKIVKDSKRSVTNIERSIDLNTELWFSSGYTPEETSNTPEEMPSIRGFTTGEMQQSKVKERKEEYIVDTPLSRFKVPTLDEVIIYCSERKNNVEPDRFMDYYESKGWMVGKSKMKNWKAAVRTWEHNGFSNNDDEHKRRDEPSDDNGHLTPTPIPPDVLEVLKRTYEKSEQS